MDHCLARIQPNLHSAILRIRDYTQSRVIWVDALSIDQAQNPRSLAEKARQVSLLNEIFGNAEEVIIDLGAADKETESTLRTLDRFQAVSDDDFAKIQLHSGRGSVPQSVKLATEAGLPGPESQFWKHFQIFMCRPWFRRVWIIQEYALSSKARFMVGSHFRPKEFLPDAILRAGHYLEILYLHDRFHNTTQAFDSVIADAYWVEREHNAAAHQICQAASQTAPSKTLCDLLESTRTFFHATQDCDKVYALLGLAADPKIRDELFVDYHESLPEFMLRVTRYLMSHDSGAYAMTHCIGDRDSYISWGLNLLDVPDDFTYLVIPAGHTRQHVFGADGSGKRFVNRPSNTRTNGLTVRGQVVDNLHHAMREGMPKAAVSRRAGMDEYGSWFIKAVEWMLLVATLQPLETGDFTKLCWRTVIADLLVPGGYEGHGWRRCRDWADSKHSIKAWDMVMSISYRKHIGELPPHYTVDITPRSHGFINIWGESATFACGRKLALTERLGSPCLVPAEARDGDLVCIIQGCPLPFIIRQMTDAGGPFYRIVGCAYVNGIMDGESTNDGGVHFRDIEIC
ncbi:hypothetical protein B0A52_07370 [Exophiala mesophila]|uniref:Heterokaryon incompatibility domain-containing protein n=1 Tax=Exophiala mesophila TaxID=212818 RepID=A0A438MX90_EXOME|nr:hypothetical protein B0A52_07370 [Exophiala mesophila]